MGACCFSEGNCASLSAGDCSGAGGLFAGGGTVCSDPLFCPTGPCCEADGSCSTKRPAECVAGGSQFGDPPGGNCGDVGMCPIGCCCLQGGGCNETPLFVCENDLGLYVGDGCVCPPPFGCPPQGACCLQDGSCIDDVARFTCDVSIGGAYQGDNSDCGSVSCP